MANSDIKRTKRVRSDIRSAAFALFLCFFLCLPICFAIANKNGAPLPDALKSEEAKYLEGGIAQTHLSQSLSLKSFLRGETQENLETFIGNNIPAKQTALLGNAALQRTAIEASNFLFQWQCYPTYFGSARVFIPSENALAIMPAKSRGGDTLQWMKTFASNFVTFAEKNPELSCVVILADMASRSEANPAVQLVSDVTTTEECAKEIQRNLDKSTAENVYLASVCYKDTQSYYKDYYRSDHHWNGYGALAAYEQIADRLGLNAKVISEERDAMLQGAIQNGSYSRAGLLLINELVSEPQIDTENLANESGQALPKMFDHSPLTADNEGLDTEFNFYHAWYGPSSSIVIENRAGSGNALVVGDSFSSAFQWFVAKNYARTLVILDCHDYAEQNLNIREYLSQGNYDAIFFVAHPGGLINLSSKSPDYFAD